MFEIKNERLVVLKYYLYRAAGNPGFFWPIYTLYLLDHGLTFTQLGLIGTVQSVIMVAGEIPTGYVGDRVGRRNSILIAQVLFLASVAGMILGETFLAFAFAFSLLSVAQTFTSGSTDAWLYETLEEHLDESRFTEVRGRGGAIGQYVMAGTMVGGSLLYVVAPTWPFIAGFASRAVAGLVVLTMPKNAQYADDEADGGPGMREALPIVYEQVTSPRLRSFVAYMALFLGATMTVGVYIQPVARDAIRSGAGELLAAYGVPAAASLGVLYASFTVVSGVASARSSDVEEWLGTRGAFLVVPFVVAASFLAPLALPVLAIPMFFVLRGGQSLLRPISGQFLNDRVESVGRATVLSTISMAYGLARAPFMIASGVLADASSAFVAVGALGVTFLVGGAALQLLWPPVSEPAAETPTAAPAD